MAVIKWLRDRASQPITIMSTELNSLAASTGQAISAAIVNASDLDLFVDLELNVTFATGPTVDTPVEIYFARSVDAGTNYEDGSTTAGVFPKSGFVGAWLVRAVTTAQRMIFPQATVPPADFKVLVINKTNQAFPASGSTIRGNFYKQQVV